MTLILQPGTDPPALTPYCAICQLPVERFTLDVVTSPHHIGLHCQCCDRVSSTRIATSVYLEMLATGKKLYCIVPKGSVAGLRGQRAHLRSMA